MDAQADLSLRWAHSHFVGIVTSRLIVDYAIFTNWMSPFFMIGGLVYFFIFILFWIEIFSRKRIKSHHPTVLMDNIQINEVSSVWYFQIIVLGIIT